MRAYFRGAALLAAVMFTAGVAYSQVDIGVSIGGGDRDGFYVAVGNYYRIPEREVLIVRDRRVREEEIPVVFYFAQMARVRPSIIVDLREDGLSWMDIALRFRLSPSLFYDPEYNRQYIDERYRPGRGWGRIRFADDDFIRYCNIRFLSEQYHYRPEAILRMREHQRDFFYVHNDIRHEMEHRDSREGWEERRTDRRDDHQMRQDRPDWRDRNRNAEVRHDNGRNADAKPNNGRTADVKPNTGRNAEVKHDSGREQRNDPRNQDRRRTGRERE